MQSSKLATFGQSSPRSPYRDSAILDLLSPGALVTPSEQRLTWSSFDAFALACRTRQRGGIAGLRLYPWQRDFIEIVSRRSLIVAKSRQTGCSQIAILWMLFQALSQPGYMGLIVSKSFADAQLLARRVRRAVAGLGISPLNDSLALMAFDNDSVLIFRSIEPAENVGRGVDCLDFLLLDEASFYSDLGGALTSLGPALSSSENGRMVIISTPNGRTGGYWSRLIEGLEDSAFEDALSRCRAGDTAYEIHEPNEGLAKLFVHWRAIPAYRSEPDFLGRVRKEFSLSEADVRQEYDLNFEQSSQSVFDFALVKNSGGHTLQGLDEDGVYFCGLYPASIGDDYTVFIVIKKHYGDDREWFTVEKIYRRKSGTSEVHMSLICDLIKRYNPVRTTIEKNSIGALYLERIASVCQTQLIEGFNTSQQTKALLVGRITLALEREEIYYPSGPIEQELLSFRRNGDKMEAAPKSHDDCVIALGLALTAADYGIKRQILVGA